MRPPVKSNGKPMYLNLMEVAARLRTKGLYAQADKVFSSAKQAYVEYLNAT